MPSINVPGLLTLALILTPVIFTLWALVDCLRRPFRNSTTKLMWVLVIVFGVFVGALVYTMVGRSQAGPRQA